MTAQTTNFSGLLYYNPAGPGFSADIRATVTADTVSRPALTIYAEPGYTGLPSEGTFNFSYWYSNGSGPLAQIFHYEFGGVDGVIIYANVLGDQNYGIRAVDDIFITLTDPFFMSGLYGTVVLKVGTIGNTGDEGNYQKFDVVSWGIASLGGLNQLATSSSTCSVTLNGDTKHYRIESDNSQVQIDSLPEHAHEPLSLASGALYWRVANLQNLTTNRFLDVSGQLFIANNRSSFNVHVDANNTTATGPQTYDVIIDKTPGGGIPSGQLAVLPGIVVNDTSLSVPASLAFSNIAYLEVQGTTSDWALGTTWTMEWWGKADRASAENRLMAVFGQNAGNSGIDIFQQRGKLYLGKSEYTDLGAEPTPGVWTHVAVVSNAGTVTVYYNGTSVYGPTAVGYNLTNSTDKLFVGIRSLGNSPVGSQAFSGQLTGIRITNTAVYSGTFDPLTVALPPAKVTGTRLLINPAVGVTSFLDTSDSAHTLPGQNVSISEYYPPSVQLTSGTSLSFSGSNQDVQVTGTRTDWALGTTWTVEWWEKIPYSASGFFGIMSQDSNDGGNPQPYTGPLGFDIYHANGYVQLYNGRWSFTQPTQGVWNHVAIQNNNGVITPYINGVATSIYAASPTLGLTNSTNDLVIGLRSADGASPGYSQWFVGQLANIRISNVARYTVTFTPPTTVVVDANTVLALDGSTNAMLDDVSASNHTITNNGTTVTLTSLPYSRSFVTQGVNPLSTTVFQPPVFPVSVIGWTITGPGITQTTTVTGQSNNQFGQTTIDYTPAFVYAPGTYVFTPP